MALYQIPSARLPILGPSAQQTSIFPPNQPEVWLGYSDRYWRTLQPQPVPYLQTTPTRGYNTLDWQQVTVDVVYL